MMLPEALLVRFLRIFIDLWLIFDRLGIIFVILVRSVDGFIVVLGTLFKHNLADNCS